jgi:hypothetical protein
MGNSTDAAGLKGQQHQQQQRSNSSSLAELMCTKLADCQPSKVQ